MKPCCGRASSCDRSATISCRITCASRSARPRRTSACCPRCDSRSALESGLAVTHSASMSNYVVQPATVVGGAIRVPGDKSISHRALMVGGLAEGITEVRGFLESEDCLSTLKAMRALGVRVEQTGTHEVRVHGVGLKGLKAASHPLDMGNAGTAMRLMTGLLSGQSFDSELIGDSSLMKRPMERAATPLRQMGARIETLNGKPPVKIRGGAPL